MTTTFFKSLTFKIGLIIILVEIVALTLTGYVYTERFSEAVDRRVRERLQLPGALMAGGVLTFDAVSDRERLEGLVGQEIEAGAVVGIRRTVFYALDPAFEGQAVADLPQLNPAWFSGEVRQPFVETVVESGQTFLVSITPVISIDGATPAFFVYLEIQSSGQFVPSTETLEAVVTAQAF